MASSENVTAAVDLNLTEEKENEIDELNEEIERLRLGFENSKNTKANLIKLIAKITEYELMISKLINLNINNYEGRQTLKNIIASAESNAIELKLMKDSINLVIEFLIE